MKKFTSIVWLMFIVIALANAQSAKERTMENRSRELVRILGLASEEDWQKFIVENCSGTLISRQLKIIEPTEESASTIVGASDEGNVESKVAILAKLHTDVGKGTITCIDQNEDRVDVMVRGETGVTVFLVLQFLRESPYLIDAMSVQIESDHGQHL